MMPDEASVSGMPAASVPRDLDEALARWVLRHTGCAPLARAARAASRAEGDGHVCVDLDDPGDGAPFTSADCATLRASAWVGDGSMPTPFVFTADGRFFLWRNWQHEQALAVRLRALAGAPDVALPDGIGTDLDRLFAGMPADKVYWQRAAIACALGRSLFVLTGGPGTGKTTTVLRLLLMLRRHAAALGLPPEPAIALAAPTGKAAQRLGEALREGVARLAGTLDATWQPTLARVPAATRTLHVLLGFQPWADRFAHGAQRPLAADVVVVDEASMVDLALMRRLVESLRPGARLVLLGDADQLASVAAGSVLADLVAAAPRNAVPAAHSVALAAVLDPPLPITATPAPLAGSVLALTHVWRNEGRLKTCIEALRHADAGVLAELAAGGDDEVRLHRVDSAAALRARVRAWLAAEPQAALHAALFAGTLEPGAALARLRESQVLCALRDGPFGASGLNALIGALLRQQHGVPANLVWYPGRIVVVTRNDYAHGLFNGDIGVAVPGPGGLRVWFEGLDGEGRPMPRSFSPRSLPAHEDAFAITIHRSQGSEYAAVAVVLPADPANRVLSRQLVYTAVSRAKRRAELWGLPEVLDAAVARAVGRLGTLSARLAGG